MIQKTDLGIVTAYGYAVEGGYTGTEEEFETLLANLVDDIAELEGMTVEVTTLPAGSQATASYADGVISLGIPRGDKGETGSQGEKGDTGNGVANISVEKTSSEGLIDTYTMTTTYTDGTSDENTFTVTNGITYGDLSWYAIRMLVRSGLHTQFFEIGNQLIVNYTVNNVTYEVPFDVVSFEEVDGKPAMWLQSHYALDECQFDQNEGFFVVPSGGLPAGSYRFTFGTTWGSNIVAGDTYSFVLTEDYAEGDIWQLGKRSAEFSIYDSDPSDWRVRTYKATSSETAGQVATPTEIVSLTKDASGTTDLGTITSSIKYDTSGLNNLQRACYGYNRWSQSAYRQWLNSEALSNWWVQQNPYDRRPASYSVSGFLSRFDEDFVSCLYPMTVITALNTVSDYELGSTDTTVDRMFLPALEQEYITPQLTGEGNYWPYWKQRLDIPSPSALYSTDPKRIGYRYDAHTTAVYCRLRSAHRGYATNAWNVRSSGNVNHYNSPTSYRSRPACVIC